MTSEPSAPAAPPPAATPRPLQAWAQRHTGLLVFLGALILYLPCAGSYGLWDPWETHYGEVARQMTARNDHISLWWPGSPRETATFQTKPVLTFWIMSLSMRAFGIGAASGPAHEMALGTRAEWALRTPFCLLGALGIFAVYLVTAHLAGRRAGIFATLVTATFPMYALVARQAMTDMGFVALMSLALALTALALEPARADLPARSDRFVRLATLGFFLLATVPQLLVDSIDLRVFIPWGGKRVMMYGVVAMIPYWIGTAAVVIYVLRTRRREVHLLLAAATLAGLAVLAKGIAGLGLPVIVALSFVAVRGSWRRFAERELLLALVACLIVAAVVAVPWHHAMYVRHGDPWWNELFGDNHWKRMLVGRHGERGNFSYFLRQLGYGAWPSIGLGAAALAYAVLGRKQQPGHRAALDLGVLWFVGSYAVVSLSMTKFHHYILPALPGLGIVIGCWLDQHLRREHMTDGDSWAHTATLPVAALTALPVLGAVTYDLVATPRAAERFLWLFSYDYVYSANGRPWPPVLDFRVPLLSIGAALALATLLLLVRRTRALGVYGLGGVALLATYFLIDGFMPAVAPHWSQKGTIARYYRERRGPDERLIAYQMFWRGETFYTKNAIFEGPDDQRTLFDYWKDTDERLKRFLANHRGRRHFFMFLPSRESKLRALLPPEAAPSFRIIERSNNLFVLAVADL